MLVLLNRRRMICCWGIFLSVAIALVSGTVQEAVDADAKVVKKVSTTQRVVALTFDDGPNAKTTPEIMAVLKEKHVRATFFVLGENVERHPEIVAFEVSSGHEIGSHAYSHQLLRRLSNEDCERELTRAEQVISAVAPRPKLFRPPGGAYNDRVLQDAKQHGYTTVTWSVDPRDWSRPSVDSVIRNVVDRTKPGSIILLHDGQYPLPTPKAVGEIIDRLRSEGYEFVTVSELLSYYDVGK